MALKRVKTKIRIDWLVACKYHFRLLDKKNASYPSYSYIDFNARIIEPLCAAYESKKIPWVGKSYLILKGLYS